MKVTYDKTVDAMYVYLSPKKKGISDTREINTGWIADYAGKELVGIEILNASKVLGAKLGLKPSIQNYSTPILSRIR